MSDEPRARDWRLLGLEPGADLDQVQRAHRRRVELYRGNPLSTYSLLLEDERDEHVRRLDEAYARIVAAAARRGDEDVGPAANQAEPVSQAAPPDLTRSPGAFLRHARLSLGVTLEEVAAVTKIRPSILACIESEELARLPSPVYVRGFVLELARMLKLPDADRVAALYVERLREHENDRDP